jgi:prepilin-type N-terminal cleavage/methylation domain-containing protein
MKNGFTLIELLIVIAITAILSGIVLFSANLYIDKGKDSNISGNLVALVPAGEVWYNGNNYSYDGFCNPVGVSGNSVIENAISQMPQNASSATGCYNASLISGIANPAGVCCNVGAIVTNNDAWAACAQKFTDSSKAFCVDSRGVSGEIDISNCNSSIVSCS